MRQGKANTQRPKPTSAGVDLAGAGAGGFRLGGEVGMAQMGNIHQTEDLTERLAIKQPDVFKESSRIGLTQEDKICCE